MSLINSIKRFLGFQRTQPEFKKPETYFIEFRIQGKLKRYSRRLIKELSNKFGGIGTNRKRIVPHFTIIIPFKTKYPEIMLKEVVQVFKKYNTMKVKTTGFQYFNNTQKKVIYISFSTPKELLMLRNDLASALNSSLPDLEKKFIIRKNPDFHLTIAFKEIDRKFKKIWAYVKNKRNPNIEVILNRVTILFKGKIYREIDLRNHRIMTREEVFKRQI
ncbi:MAG: 2'-5' RNA ligase family protein [archaeon]|nr:2'-5' RNA ligase family protein [archaeon]